MLSTYNLQTRRERRIRRSLIHFAAVAAAAAALCAALAAGQDKPAVLAFAPPAGQALVYDMECQVDSLTKFIDGSDLPFLASGRGDIRLSVRQPSRDGSVLWLSTPGVTVAYTVAQDKDRYRLRVPDGSPVRLVVGRTGRITDVQNGGAFDDRNRAAFSLIDMLGFCFPALPDAARRVGDSWPARRQIVIPFQGIKIKADLNLDFVLRDLAPTAAGRIASMTADPTVVLSGGGEFGETVGTVQGDGSGSARLRLNVDQGIIEDYRLDAQVQGRIVLRSQGVRLYDRPLRLTLAFRLERRGAF